MKRAIFFDLDGTLTDTTYCLQFILSKIMEENNFRGITLDEVKKVMGDGATKAIERSMSFSSNNWTKDMVEEGVKKFKQLLAENFLYKVKAYDGIKDVLEELKNKNIMIFCVTNKPSSATKKTLDAIFGENVFTDFVCDDGNTKLKPNPEGTLNLCKKYNLNIEECLFVGDTHTDIETGVNAGIDTIGVLWGFRDEDELKNAKATYIIKEAKEILNYI